MTTPAVVFSNPGLVDLRALLTLGVNVKPNSTNPIGYFGTGAKFAFATLLRNGCTIRIVRDGDSIDIISKPEIVRGEEFYLVYLRHAGNIIEPTGFTTTLGKSWKPWQAYRELACNASDENGSTAIVEDFPGDFAPLPDHTHIIVQGDAAVHAHKNRNDFMLTTEPDITTNAADIHFRTGRSIFYRGIAVGELPQASHWTYNIKRWCDLTEDRVVANTVYLHDAISEALDELATRGDFDTVTEIVCAPRNTWEHQINIDYTGITKHAEEFYSHLMFLGETRIADLNLHAAAIFKREAPKRQAKKPRVLELTAIQRQQLDRAVEFCERIGFDLTKFPILCAQNLGEGVLGLALDGTIYIAEATFNGGTHNIARSLVEEFVHLHHKVADETRPMQDRLIDHIVRIGEEWAWKEPL